MKYVFDRCAERRGSGSLKLLFYGEEAIPLWLAEMDFDTPPAIHDAVTKRAEHPIYGYGFDYREIFAALCARLERLYSWKVAPDEILVAPGTLAAITAGYLACTESGDEILVHGPTYPPFHVTPPAIGRTPVVTNLSENRDGDHLTYSLDLSDMKAKCTERTKIFLHCNPHNPVGKVFNREELEQIATFCLERDLVLFSDEIHAELLMDAKEHIPMATLSPEIADRTVTFLSTSKVFNLSGLGFSVAIVKNPEIRKRLRAVLETGIGKATNFALSAALACFRDCDDWLEELRSYLRENRDYVSSYLKEEMPELKHTLPEATYLMWIDAKSLAIEGRSPQKFFLEDAKVAFSDGADFGESGKGYLRMTYASPRSVLTEALEKMKAALEAS